MDRFVVVQVNDPAHPSKPCRVVETWPTRKQAEHAVEVLNDHEQRNVRPTRYRVQEAE